MTNRLNFTTLLPASIGTKSLLYLSHPYSTLSIHTLPFVHHGLPTWQLSQDDQR